MSWYYYSFFQGIRNILALGGDHSYVIKPEDEATFKDDPKLRYASDLVRQIRNEWGSEFTVCVAGYPQVYLSLYSSQCFYIDIYKMVFISSHYFYQFLSAVNLYLGVGASRKFTNVTSTR